MSFISNLFNRTAKKSGNLAKERLQLVLIHDRVKISPGMMNKMRDEIIEVISKYLDIDVDQMDISLSNTARENRLIADIPILKSKNMERGT